jgi:hypothetical protein
MVHIVQLKVRKHKLFGKAKNGSVWMHNHQAWTAEQLKRVQAFARTACELRNDDADAQEHKRPERYIDIDRKHWTRVKDAPLTEGFAS